MRASFVLSSYLHDFALFKIAIALFEADIYTVSQAVNDEEWKELEIKMVNNVQKVVTPRVLQEKISCAVKLLLSRLRSWIKWHIYRFGLLEKNNALIVKLLKNICWSSHGLINNHQTAKKIVEDTNIDVVFRFRLACVYCLNDYVYSLWNKLSSEMYYNKKLNSIDKIETPVISFWCHQMFSKPYIYPWYVAEDRSFIPLFNCACMNGSVSSVKYFLEKLTDEEKHNHLVDTTCTVAKKNSFNTNNDNEVLCYLLSIMSEQQQIEVFKKSAYYVLSSFLQWPWQHLFLETASHMWPYISSKCYHNLLVRIKDKILEGHDDFNYHILFCLFWKQGSLDYHKYVLSKCLSCKSFLLVDLFKIKNLENIKLLLKGFIDKASEKSLETVVNRGAYLELSIPDQWYFVTLYVQQIVKLHFRETLHFQLQSFESDNLQRKWAVYFQYLNNFIADNDGKWNL